MIFPYSRLDAGSPITTPGNANSRLRPLLDVLLVGPTRIAQSHRGTLDSGSDDTVMRRGRAVGGRVGDHRFASVELRLINDFETYTWNAIVGFGDGIARGLPGHAGFIQFFGVEFLGEAKQIIINPNASFSGLRRDLIAP